MSRFNHIYKTIFFVIFVATLSSCTKKPSIEKEEADIYASNFMDDWDFHLSKTQISKDSIEIGAWRKVQLPHDWVIEREFDSSLAYNAKATGYLDGEGYGYYRKEFEKPFNENEVTYLHFDGVYNNSTIYVNGQKLGFHPYGYSPFYFEISTYLNKDNSPNILEVEIDHSRFADSRWYTGAGIYRKVELLTYNKLHIPVWGIFVSTPSVSAEKAMINVNITLNNDHSVSKEFTIKTVVLNPQNNIVSTVEKSLALDAGQQIDFDQIIEIQDPALWDIEDPNLHTAQVEILENGILVDKYTSRFGVRDFSFNPNTGFTLNGKNLKIKGVCLHHDGGLVGAAVPMGVWKRRLQILKDGGCNAIRMAHNPASSDLLELCDQMGFLVQDEFFDEWDNPKDKRFNQNERSVDYVTRGYGEHFQEWAQKDLRNVILSHRNHPSIIQWSIGNEIEWTYPRNAEATGFFNNMNWKGNYFWSEPPNSIAEIKQQLETLPRGQYDIGETAKKLSKWVKELDTTRPITANCILPSASHLSGFGDALDIIGYSYRRVLYDYGHENYPDKPIMGTENLGQYHEWKAVEEKPFISGLFLWTGIDYMGEIRDPWPVRTQPSGLLSTAGFPKGSYYMFKTLWKDEPQIHIATQILEKSLNRIDVNGKAVAKDPKKWENALWAWQEVNEHWNYEDGEMISVEIYSNCEEIELFLNDESLGKEFLVNFEDHIYKWAFPYKEGILKALGKKDGKTIEEKIVTAKKAFKIELNADTKQIRSNNQDVVHFVAQLTDEFGNPVKTDHKKINFEITGPAKILGVDNGWKNSVQKFQSNSLTTHNGKALMILQSTRDKGTVTVSVTGEGLKEVKTSIIIQ